jgi:nitroreductase
MEKQMEKLANVETVLAEMNKVRQIRQYRPDPVAEEAVDALLEVARWTGSSRNTQPWHFVVVSDKGLLKDLSQLRTPINWLADAALGIAIVLDGGDVTQEAYDEGRVTERVMIAAHLLGLGSGVAWFLGADNEAEAKRLLGIPAERTAHSIIAVGHPITSKDPRPNPARGGRKPMSEIVSHNHMGTGEG